MLSPSSLNRIVQSTEPNMGRSIIVDRTFLPQTKNCSHLRHPVYLPQTVYSCFARVQSCPPRTCHVQRQLPKMGLSCLRRVGRLGGEASFLFLAHTTFWGKEMIEVQEQHRPQQASPHKSIHLQSSVVCDDRELCRLGTLLRSNTSQYFDRGPWICAFCSKTK